MKFLRIILISAISLLSSQLMSGRGLYNETLPLVKCTNHVVDQEIAHFFDLLPDDEDAKIVYWNLVIEQTSHDVQYYAMFRKMDNIPYVGDAYLQYGNNMIVVISGGELSDDVFKEVSGKERKISMKKMTRKEVRKKVNAPFLDVTINNTDGSFTSRYVCRNEEYVNYVPLSSIDTDARRLFEKIINNKILEDEVKDYLRLLPLKESSSYFLLTVREEDFTYRGDTVFSCSVQEINETSDSGDVYLEDGNKIIIVGSNNEALSSNESSYGLLSLSFTEKQLLFKLSVVSSL